MLESGINKFCSKALKKPIDLSIDVLMSDELKNALNKGTISSDLAKIRYVFFNNSFSFRS